MILLTGIKFLLELLNRGFWNLCCTSTSLYSVQCALLFGLAIRIWVHYCEKFHTFSFFWLLAKGALLVAKVSWCFAILPWQVGGLCSLDRGSVGPRVQKLDTLSWFDWLHFSQEFNLLRYWTSLNNLFSLEGWL